MDYNYVTQYDGDAAKAFGRNLPISRKKSVEIANKLRGKKLLWAERYLERVMKKKEAVPYKKYNRDTPHRKGKGITSGRYPIKTAKHFLSLLSSVKSNGEDLGLDLDNLYLKGIVVNKGTQSYHYGRHRGRKMKRSHIEIVAVEKSSKDSDKKSNSN